MAEATDYVETLPEAERNRYKEKLELIGGNDPYNVPMDKWNADVSYFPGVTYPDIVNYLVFTSNSYTMDHMKSFKGLEAYNQFVCGWICEVAAFIQNGLHVVKSRVKHSQSWRKTPLFPWIVAEKSGKDLAAHCDCKAGLGEGCSHVGALLFYLEACVRIRDSKTVTQEKAYWKLPAALKEIEYRPIQDIDFTSAKSKQVQLDKSIDCDSLPCQSKLAKPPRVMKKASQTPSTTPEELNSFFKDISLCGVKPAILSIIPPYSTGYIPRPVDPSFPQLLTDLRDDLCTKMGFHELLAHCEEITINVTQEQAANVEEATKAQAHDKLWFQCRAGRITASRFKAVCHSNPASPCQSLVKAICYPESVRFTSAATAWGCTHEKLVRDLYYKEMAGRHTNFSVLESGLMINTAYPYLGASPDGVIKCDCCGTGCVEIKCPFCKHQNMLTDDSEGLTSCLEKNDKGQVKLKLSHAYYYQIQCQMNVGKFEFADFVLWTGKEMYIERVECDSEFFAAKAALANDFFKVAILPELVGKFYSHPPLSTPVHKNVQQASSGVNVGNDDFEVWCLCKRGLDAELIGCDNNSCPTKWFHFKCVGVKTKPRGKWYCPDCRKLPQFKHGKKSGLHYSTLANS